MGKFFSTLRSRLILMIVLTSIPGIFLLVNEGINQRKQAVEAAEAEVIHLEHVASNMEALMVENVKAFLLTLSHLPSLQDNQYFDCRGIFSHLVAEHFYYYSSFYVADLEGNIVCKPPNNTHEPNLQECDHYAALIQADDFTLSGYHVCKQTGEAVLSIGLPIFNAAGERTLVTNVSIDLIWFYNFAVDVGLPPGSELVMMDEKGVILSHYPDNDRWRGYSVPANTALAQLFKQKHGTLIGPGLDGKEMIYAISPMENTYQKLYVALGRSTKAAFASANRMLVANLLIMLAVMAGAIVLIWFAADRLILKQTRTLVQATQQLARGDLSVRTNLDYAQGEMGQLAQAFDKMADELALHEAERDQAEAELNEYARNLEHTNQELRDFTNIASHDLQEPLRKIQTFGELLQERCAPNLDAQGADYVRRMQDAARRMQALVAELLVYSRLTSRAQPFSRVDLTQVTQQVLADFDMLIEEKEAQVHLTPLPTVEGDQIQLSQLMQNLVGNALKFHKKDRSPVVHIYSPQKDAASTRNGFCEICVEDEGIGFEPKYTDRIFQPFQRLHGRDQYEGTGMGLAICRKIVDRHGGTIHVESTPNVGTKFTIRLPYKQRSERSVIA